MMWSAGGGRNEGFFRPFGASSPPPVHPGLTPRATFSRPCGVCFCGATGALLIRGGGKIGQLPLPDQTLGMRIAGCGGKRAQIRRSVDVKRNAGQ